MARNKVRKIKFPELEITEGVMIYISRGGQIYTASFDTDVVDLQWAMVHIAKNVLTGYGFEMPHSKSWRTLDELYSHMKTWVENGDRGQLITVEDYNVY